MGLSGHKAGLLWVALFFVQPIHAGHGVETSYLIKLRSEKKNSILQWLKTSELQNLGIRYLEDLGSSSGLLKVGLNGNESEALHELRNHPQIEYVVRNSEIRGTSWKRKAIRSLQDQWGLEKIQAPLAWEYAQSQGSSGVVVAVIDTGVDLEHEALKSNLVSGYDFKDDDLVPQDETSFLNPGHGTHCAGIIGATGAGGGVFGVSPKVSLMPLRILGRDLSGRIDDAVQAIDYAILHGAHIISASWGAELNAEEAQPLVEAVERANTAGILFVSSAGNGDENGVGMDLDQKDYYPAILDFGHCLSVAATETDDGLSGFSNYGLKSVHVAAPGFKILSTLPQDRYDDLSGTSMSAPFVAGLAALLKGINFELTAAQIKEIILDSGDKNDSATRCACRINAYEAMKVARSNRYREREQDRTEYP